MFQFVPIEIEVPTAPEMIWEELSGNLYVIWTGYALIALVIFWISFLIFRSILRKNYRLPVYFQKAVLLITLPKEGARGAGEQKETPTIDNIRAQIAVAETLFSTIGGMKAERGLRAWFWGRADHMSLEIVAHEGHISFYMTIPRYLQQFLEQQIQAQYSECQIEEVVDYNIFSPKGVITGSYLTFKRSFIFPIKTYKKLDTDPLNALTNVMSKMSEEDGAAIQIVLRSAKGAWHRYGKRVASEMQQGKKLDKAMKEAQTNKTLKVIGEIFSTVVSTFKPQPKEDLKKSKEPYRLSPMEEEMVKGLEEKTSKAGMDANIRVIICSTNEAQAKMYLDNIVNSFFQFSSYEFGNSFVKSLPKSREQLATDFIYRNFDEKRQVLLNTEELASVYHFPLPSTETPNIRWLLAKKLPAPVNVPKAGELLLGENVYRGITSNIHIKRGDRRRHMYIIGMTGTGKSWAISNFAVQDIQNGEGVCVVDPHGELIENILPYIPRERAEDVIIFNPGDTERPVGLNMLEAKTADQRDFAVQEMISIFYKLFPPEMIGPIFEHNMRNVMLTLMADIENPGTIAEIPRMFTDTDFQKKWVAKLTDPVVRAFWEKEMAKTSDFHKSETLGYLISKVGRFVENEMMRNIIGQTRSGFDLRDIMDNKKILLVNLSKGKVGEVNSSLLGMIIVSKLQMAAMARGDLPEEKRHDFYLYIDEFQNFITPSVATILAEARKYRLCLIMAHQYIGQLVEDGKTEIRDSVFGNVGTILNFRIGVDDAETMAKQLAPVVNEYDVMNIEKFHAYVRLLVDNQATKAFNVHFFPLPEGRDEKMAESIIQLSRLKYGRDRKMVEAEIMERTQLGKTVSRATTEAAEPSL